MQREAALKGWVAVPIGLYELVQGGDVYPGSALKFRLTQSGDDGELEELYVTDGGFSGLEDRRQVTYVDFAGRELQLEFAPASSRSFAADRALAHAMLFGGSTIVGLLTCVMWFIVRLRLKVACEREDFARENRSLRAALNDHTLFSVADRSGTIVDVNAGFCRISGYERDELIGQDHRVLNSGHHPKSFWVDMWKTIAAGRPWRGEVCNRRKDGELYWVDSTNIPQLDEDGRVDRFISLRFDITAQKTADAALQEIRTALDAANDCVFMFDADTFRFVYTNHGASQQVGYSAEELRGMTPIDIKPHVDESHFRAMIAPLYESPGESIVFRTEHEHRSGRRVPVEISLQLIQELGDAGRFVAIVRDITEQLEIERQILEQRSELQSIIDAIPASVFYKDDRNTILTCNQTAADAVGCRAV